MVRASTRARSRSAARERRSKKNVVDPDQIIHDYGADTRWFMLSDSPPERDLE
jgi:leucyl-tRNA synthetase